MSRRLRLGAANGLDGPMPTIPTRSKRRRSEALRGASADPLATPKPTMPTRPARRSASPARRQRENSQDEIYERIYVAILEHLDHIEGSMKLEAPTEDADLEAIFRT